MTEVNEVRTMSKSFVHWTGIPSLASSTVSLESRIVPGIATRAPPGRATQEETLGWDTPHTQLQRAPTITGILVAITLVQCDGGIGILARGRTLALVFIGYLGVARCSIGRGGQLLKLPTSGLALTVSPTHLCLIPPF